MGIRMRIHVLGALTLAALFASTKSYGDVGKDWQAATPSADWSPRGGQSSVVFNNKIWVIGGGGGEYGDAGGSEVWYSSNGIDWTQATASAPWGPRQRHTSVVFDNKIWVLGGYRLGMPFPSGYANDVWYSPDGANWTLATSSAQWDARDGHSSVVFNGEIWVMGGDDGTGRKGDVWHSWDGAAWTRATAAAAWPARFFQKSVVFNGMMWVIGGSQWTGHVYFNDVWRSSNGRDWTRATASAGWLGRDNHCAVVHDGKMWVLGGGEGDLAGAKYNDVWHSSDGSHWSQATAASPWPIRLDFSAVSFDGAIWMMGGYTGLWSTGPTVNDVWFSASPSGVGKGWALYK